MLDIPFELETIPADKANNALEILTKRRSGAVPVLLGDADIFSVEWAEIVDAFEPPEDVIKAALAVDTDAWFANQPVQRNGSDASNRAESKILGGLYSVVSLPKRWASWSLTRTMPDVQSTSLNQSQNSDEEVNAGIEMLKSQLAELEAAGEGTEDELNEIRQIIDEITAEGACYYPDPVAYVTPRHGDEVAAGMVKVTEPWEVAAWLQHGTYALCAPKPVFVAQCKWMWDQFGARIITASTDHVGFQIDQQIEDLRTAKDVLHRFQALGATEVNAEQSGSDGKSMVNADRLWVWWD